MSLNQVWFIIIILLLLLLLVLGLVYGLLRHFKQYFSYFVAVSFIGGGNRSTRR